jgi:DNA-binding Lrp family transcriptional regulator
VVILQELDATDRRILAALDDDPRVPVMLLAQKLGLARGTVQSRLERMSASGALRPNSSRVLPSALGRGVAAAVSADLYRVSEEIRLCPGIVRTSTSMFLREVIPYRTTGLLGA